MELVSSEADELAQVFREFDRDNSGSIDKKELSKALRQLGITVGDAILKNVMKGYDADNSGTLEIGEFRNLVAELREYQAEHPTSSVSSSVQDDKVRQVFKRWDRDGSGDMDPKELKHALRELGLKLDNSEALQVLDRFDKDRSGALGLEEFTKLATELRAFQAEQQAAEAKQQQASEAKDSAEQPSDAAAAEGEQRKGSSFLQSARSGTQTNRVYVAALAKQVPKRSYLPKFRARKSDAEEKKGNFEAFMEKQREEEAKAEEARRRRRRRRKKKDGAETQQEEEDQDDGGQLCTMVLGIVLTLLITLAEAFDLDVLVMMLLTPFIKGMQWFAAEFDNQSLDPMVWAAKVGNFTTEYTVSHPLGFVLVDFGLFFLFATYFLFEADLRRWWATRNARNAGYEELDDEDGKPKLSGFLAKVASDPEALQQLLRQANEDLEEHDLVVRLRGAVEADVKADMDAKRSTLEDSIKTYTNFLSAIETEKAEAVDLEEAAREAAAAEAKKKREGGCADTTKMAGRSVYLLKEHGGYGVDELREYGFVVAELRGIYTVLDMRTHGFSLDELGAGGVPAHAVAAVDGRSTAELRGAGYTAKILRKVGFDLGALVGGGYSATELKEARYGAAELKGAGFDAGALRVAGFTSKQLRAAKYKLRELQAGGYFWKDLVIFLRATHAELTDAGYVGLDPLHRLFLEYRPEPDDEEAANPLSVLSPRGPAGLGLLCTADKLLVLREGPEIESPLCNKSIPAGRDLIVAQVLQLADGTRRGHVALEKRPTQTLGWVTLVFKDGATSVSFWKSSKPTAMVALGLDHVTPRGSIASARGDGLADFVPVPRWRSFAPIQGVLANIGDAIERGTRALR